MHRTLNHLLDVDLTCLSRFTGEPTTIPDFGIDRYADFTELWGARIATDRRISEWATTVTPEWL
ncbi:MAG: damage-inducible protein DinB, partial [Alkalinema sp. RL_2_19]|nr:damage-inducible protein DinB [Alkalinema sp. RL_2_19]